MGAPGTTPGQWFVDPLGLGTIGDVSLANGDAIAQAQMRKPNAGFGDTERIANAHQIAASGVLYDALEGMVAAVLQFEIHATLAMKNAERTPEFDRACQGLTQARNAAGGATKLARGERL